MAAARRFGPLLPAALAVVTLLLPASAARAGTVSGKVQLDLPGISLANVRPVVVYLVADGAGSDSASRFDTTQIRQKNAKFAPGFLAVSVGQTIEMPNDDAIYHNVFSFSRPNDFDLGLYAAGKSRSIAFDHPGVVNIYCSIHENMNGTIFVSPTPYFTQVDAFGAFEIRDVPAGSYRLETWTEKLPATSRPVRVTSSAAARVTVPLVGSSQGSD